MQHRYVALILFACTFATLSPLRATAVALPPVLFSEINWAGSSLSTADEWIELVNTTAQDISLAQWHVLGIGSQGARISFPDDAVIPAHGVYLVANYSHEDEKSTLAVAPQLVTSALSILNTNLAISLVDHTGVVVDSVLDAGVPDAGSSALFSSMERDTFLDTWFTAETTVALKDSLGFGTPGTFVLPSDSLAEEDVSHEDALPLMETPLVDDSIGDDLSVSEDVAEEAPVIPDAEVLATPVEEDLLEEVVTDPQEEVTPALPEEIVLEEDVVLETETEAVTPVLLIAPLVPEIVTEALPEEPASTADTTDVTETPPDVPSSSTPPRILDYSPLRVTEFLSSPSDGVEFVEIYYSGDSGDDLPLEGLFLADASGKQTLLSGSISPGEYVVLRQPLGKLNNTGDVVTLTLSDGQMLFSLTYGTELFPAPKKGLSAGLCADGWRTALLPSPGLENSCPTISTPNTAPSYDHETSPTTTLDIDRSAPGSSSSVQGNVSSPEVISTTTSDDTTSSLAEPVIVTEALPPSLEEQATSSSSSLSRKTSSKKSGTASQKTPLSSSVAELPTVAHGQVVEVTGSLIALPGSFGKRIAYLHGVQLYFHKADWPDLSLDSLVRVVGTWDFSDGNRRIKIASRDDIAVLGEDSATPLLWENLPADQEEDVLAVVQGTLARKDGDAFILTLAHGAEVPVLDIAKTQALSVLRAGDAVTITGIRMPHDGRMVLAPRSSEDVVLQHADNAAPTTSRDTSPIAPAIVSSGSTPYIGGGILVSSLSALGYWFVRTKKYSFLLST